MTETTRATLRALLETGYAAFRDRLRKRLGSQDLADEALQDTWLRLAHGGEVGALRNPDRYLFRIALNAAADRREAESRRLSQAEVYAVLHLADHMLDAGQIADMRAEFSALEQALLELPPRRRQIFILARVEEVAHDEIARRFGISSRMVEKDLRQALDHCSERLGRNVVRRFGPRSREPS
jgi:RNA polymerase sigma-70 factor (ECF subfamily)